MTLIHACKIENPAVRIAKVMALFTQAAIDLGMRFDEFTETKSGECWVYTQTLKAH